MAGVGVEAGLDPAVGVLHHRKQRLHRIAGVGHEGEAPIEALAIRLGAGKADNIAVGQVAADIGQVVDQVGIGRPGPDLLSVSGEAELGGNIYRRVGVVDLDRNLLAALDGAQY